MKGAGRHHHAPAFRPAGGVMMPARQLDRAFHRFRAGIAEERRVREGRVDQLLRQTLLTRDLIEVGDMPKRRRLVLQRLDKARVAMA